MVPGGIAAEQGPDFGSDQAGGANKVVNLPSQDIKSMLESAGLGLTFGVNLFIGSEPTAPTAVTTIYDTPGFAPDGTLQKGEETWRPAVQVKVRNPSYVAAGVLINQIKDVLHNLSQDIWNGTRYTLIQCAQEPFSLGLDPNNLSQWVANFDIQRS
jgi:hypothetical protein